MIDWLQNHLFTCYFKLHLGVDCPGCGSQRALIALLKGNLSESISYHAALIPLLITVIALIIQLNVKHVNGSKWVMCFFILTVSITMLQFITKQIIFLQIHESIFNKL